MIKYVCIFSFILIGINSCTSDKTELLLCDTVNADYSESVALIIQTRCALSGCHIGDSVSVGNFNNYSEIKERVDNGTFREKVIDSKTMPPSTKPPLTTQEYTILKCWYEAGASGN